jgi:hypothetical protein
MWAVLWVHAVVAVHTDLNDVTFRARKQTVQHNSRCAATAHAGGYTAQASGLEMTTAARGAFTGAHSTPCALNICLRNDSLANATSDSSTPPITAHPAVLQQLCDVVHGGRVYGVTWVPTCSCCHMVIAHCRGSVHYGVL